MEKSAQITIKRLRTKTIIGTKSSERKRKQPIIVDLVIWYDAQRAARSDKLAEALNYQELADHIKKEIEASRFYLLEKLADDVLKIVMQYKPVKKARVHIEKPDALPYAKSVSLEIEAGGRF